MKFTENLLLMCAISVTSYVNGQEGEANQEMTEFDGSFADFPLEELLQEEEEAMEEDENSDSEGEESDDEEDDSDDESDDEAPVEQGERKGGKKMKKPRMTDEEREAKKAARAEKRA